MGTIFRLLLTRFLPARIGWVIAAFVFARALAARKNPTPVPQERSRRSW